MRLPRSAAIVLAAAIIVGCVPQQTLPATCNDPSVTLHATLNDEHLEPAILEACRGQKVTMTVVIERDGIFHLHGYDDQTSATEVRAGQTLNLELEAVRSGQFPIALHTTDGPAEAIIGTFIVYEP
jgi:hypothetical protein